MKAIETMGLTKRYGTKTAVDSLNLEIEKGELFALLGVNGAGKTTAIKMLSCLTRPTGGDARVLGFSVVSDAIRVKERINVSPQESAMAPNLTVRENLELIAGIYGDSWERSRGKAHEAIASFGLGEYTHRRSKTLSGGYMRRLSIAMALISDPEILFLDEPTLGLDVIARRELWAGIEKLKGKVTVILTTHYMEEAEALSDRVGVMAAGRLKAVGTAKELTERTSAKTFEDAFIALAGGEGTRL